MKQLQGIVLILTCVALSAKAAAHLHLYKAEAGQVKEFQMERGSADGTVVKVLPNDLGNITNCGDKSYKLQFQWSPAIINTADIVTIYLDIVAANDWISGTLYLEVSLNDDPQGVIYSLDRELRCAEGKLEVPSINCPVTKGDESKGQKTISDLSKLPTGEYTVELKITNDKNLIVFCVRGTVNLIKRP